MSNGSSRKGGTDNDKTPTDLFHIAEQIKSHIIKYGEKNAIGRLNLMWKALDIQCLGANPAPPSIMAN